MVRVASSAESIECSLLLIVLALYTVLLSIIANYISLIKKEKKQVIKTF